MIALEKEKGIERDMEKLETTTMSHNMLKSLDEPTKNNKTDEILGQMMAEIKSLRNEMTR